jgi:DNA polymerase-3 subunit epsilon
MTSPILFIDFETSGLDANRHAILQAAWIIEKDGVVTQERVYDVQPDQNDDLCMAALEVNGFTFERLKAGKYVSLVLEILKQECLPYVGLRPCGHNVTFDIDFLVKVGRRHGENPFVYLDIRKSLDTHALLHYLDYKGKLSLSSYTLVSACHYFGIPLKAHDALEDIRATRILFHKLEELL